MNSILKAIIVFSSVKGPAFIAAGILLFSLFHGKISSWLSVRSINKIITSKHDIVNEIKTELIITKDLSEAYEDYYNSTWKYATYLLLGIISFIQLIGLLLAQTFDEITTNVCMVTMTIAFIEFRDNKRLSVKLKKELNSQTNRVAKLFATLETMADEDFVLDHLVREGHITAEERTEFIKKTAS